MDASEREGFVLEDVAAEELPEVMRPMTPVARQGYLEKMRANRGRMQKEIGVLANKRKDWIQKKLQEQGLDESKSFDGALRKALREQVRAKGFKYPTIPPAQTEEAPPSGQKQEPAEKAAPAERKLGC